MVLNQHFDHRKTSQLSKRDESKLVGIDGHRILHKIQRARSRMVLAPPPPHTHNHRRLCTARFKFCSLISSSVSSQGHLRHCLIHPRRTGIEAPPHTDQESHQVCTNTLSCRKSYQRPRHRSSNAWSIRGTPTHQVQLNTDRDTPTSPHPHIVSPPPWTSSLKANHTRAASQLATPL